MQSRINQLEIKMEREGKLVEYTKKDKVGIKEDRYCRIVAGQTFRENAIIPIPPPRQKVVKRQILARKMKKVQKDSIPHVPYKIALHEMLAKRDGTLVLLLF